MFTEAFEMMCSIPTLILQGADCRHQSSIEERRIICDHFNKTESRTYSPYRKLPAVFDQSIDGIHFLIVNDSDDANAH